MHAATKGGNHDTLSLLLDQLNTTQMSIAGMGMTRFPCIGLPTVEH